jgi:hypothetical protein
MSSQVEICNVALTILGAAPINAITDQTNQARALNALWNIERDAELRAHRWKFSITRATMPALAAAPLSGPYTQQFQLPAGTLRVLEIGDSYPASDLSDYRSGPTTGDYSIEGGMVLSNLPAPLSIRYIQQITDPTQFDPAFSDAFAARLAKRACFRITQSLAKEKDALADYGLAIKAAILANALETTPTFPADDTWVAARLGGGINRTIVNF